MFRNVEHTFTTAEYTFHNAERTNHNAEHNINTFSAEISIGIAKQ